MDAADKDRLWAELDELGEDQIREKLGLGHYGVRRKGGVEEWLRQEEHKRASRDNTPWHKTWLGIVLIGLVIGLSVAGLSYLFGWQGEPNRPSPST